MDLRNDLSSHGLLSLMDSEVHVDEPEPLQLYPEYYQEVYDASTGERLPPELVAKGRAAEMEFMRGLRVWTYATISACLQATGRKPISVGWVDINKGDRDNLNVRCRLTVQETKRQTTLDSSDVAATFAATPPYEALRFLLSCWMTPKSRDEWDHVVVFIDISRAHPHAPIRRDLWIVLPPEDPRAGEPNVCGKLGQSLYGAKDASQNFELFTSDTMVSLGFTGGLWSPCLFHHDIQNILCYVYGDNFVAKMSRANVEWFVSELKKYMIANVEGILGPDPSKGDVDEVVCLNRIFRYCRAEKRTTRRCRD